MNLLFRLLIVLVGTAFRPRLALDHVSRIRNCVLPNDLDLNLHMNNGRYLTVLDLGRIDFLLRVGLGKVLLRNRWRPLIGGTLIHYRFGLRAFEAFDIVTRVECWDDKWFYFDQRIETGRGVAAVAVAKGLVRDRDGTVSPQKILQAINLSQPSPSFPESVSRWLIAEQMLHIGDRR
jgi:acyl-CoA thioesterase FadM